MIKKICCMTGTVFNPERPGQSIRELKNAGIREVMFDFGFFVSPEWILADRNNEEHLFKPESVRKSYKKSIDGFAAGGFLPSIARLPLVNVQTRCKEADLNSLILRIDLDCIRECEQTGCRTIIVQPLFFGLERDMEWEANREFYLTLAAQCKEEDTRLLLVDQCRDINGHLVRGICSDGKTAAEWVDRLNREAGMDRFGFCLDVGSCHLCGQNIQSFIGDVGNRINAVLLSENDGHTMARRLPFTCANNRQSVMDWLGVVRGLREIGFDGCLILETTDTTASFSPLLQPYLVPVYKALLDYFELQIDIEKHLRKYEHIALFGAGNMCRNYMKCYGEKYPPLFTCDNNPKLWGTQLEGLEVKNPEELKHLPENCGVIICNIFYQEIEQQLRSMGVEHIGYFNDEYMPSYYFDRLKRVEQDF